MFNKVVAEKSFNITVGGRKVQKLSLSYTEAGNDEILALFGSSGWLEISLKDGNCQKELQVKKGTAVEINFS
jgi:S-adenosylmethionine hydrolase